MSLIDLWPTTKLGYAGGRPNDFELGPTSTLHYESSLNGQPPFTSYSSAYLRTLQPTKLGPGIPVKYLDNPPK